MPHVVDTGLAAATLIGHFALAVWLFNRLHALPWPRGLIRGVERLLLLTAAVVLALFVWRIAIGASFDARYLATHHVYFWLLYVSFCQLVFLASIPLWLIPKLRETIPDALVAQSATNVDLAEKLGHRPTGCVRTAFAAALPGNEIFRLQIAHKTLALPQMPAALDGLKIAHLSDLHMTGKLTQAFYDAVVDQTNELQPDLVVITGDIAEKEECLPWIQPTLGRLRSRLGTFFVLGNHEKRLHDVSALRLALTGAGLVDLGSRCQWLEADGVQVLLAGVELPWFGSYPPVTDFLSQAPPAAAGQRPFRILLSHTPDQYAWARSQHFDLMLAGHNHGGQIRFPLVGALIAPSRFGCRYAGGLYHEQPTLLHVSRGIAGLHSVRFNCPPELPLLTLTRE